MIDDKEWQRIKTMVSAVQRGRYLTSDRVANRIDDLAEMTFSFAWSSPKDFAEGLQLAPEEMRQHFARITELQFLLSKVEESVGDVPVEAYGKPETF